MALSGRLDVVVVNFQFNKIIFFFKFEQVVCKVICKDYKTKIYRGMLTGITNPNPNHYHYEKSLGEHISHQTDCVMGSNME